MAIFDTKNKKIFLVIGILTIALAVGLAVGIPLSKRSKFKSSRERAIEILEKHPLIDGHNDLVHVLRKRFRNQFKDFDLTKNMVNISHTDIVRAKEGKLMGQFWAVYASCDSSAKDAIRIHMEQAEVLRRIFDKYSDHMQFVTTAQGIREAFKNKKLASLLGMESGHAIDSSLSILRTFYAMGVRYMTLTHNCNTPWASNNLVDKNPDSPEAKIGLTEFGELVIKEMNRLGIIVDLSHTSHQTQLDTFRVAKAPLMYSHSSVFNLCQHPRNVRDDALKLLKNNQGVVMVNFYNGFITCNSTHATISDVVEHLNYLKKLIGPDHIGIGGDYDGVDDVPTGLEDVSKYPDLFAALIDEKWEDSELIKLAGGNVIRVLEAVENYAKSVENEPPLDDIINQDDLNGAFGNFKDCRTGI